VNVFPPDVLPISRHHATELAAAGWRERDLTGDVEYVPPMAQPYNRATVLGTTHIHRQPNAARSRFQRIVNKIRKTLKLRPHKERRPATLSNSILDHDLYPELVDLATRTNDGLANYSYDNSRLAARLAEEVPEQQDWGHFARRGNLNRNMNTNIRENPQIGALSVHDPELFYQLVYERPELLRPARAGDPPLSPEDIRRRTENLLLISTSTNAASDFRHPRYSSGFFNSVGADRRPPSAYPIERLYSPYPPISKRGGTKKRRHSKK